MTYPSIAVTPSSLIEDLMVGESSSSTLTITNSGDAYLDWSSYLADMNRNQINDNDAIVEAIDNMNERAVVPLSNSIASATGHNLDESSSMSRDAAGTVYLSLIHI